MSIVLPVLAAVLTIALVNLVRAAREESADRAARGAPVPTTIAGTRLWRGLGALWLLDGLLQLQPSMFTEAFTRGVLAVNVAGQPVWFRHLLLWSTHLWARTPGPLDLAAALLQMAIGMVLLLWPHRRLGTAGVWVSIGWGLIVWVLGEGLGGLLNGQASWFLGGPGSAPLYVAAGLLLLLPQARWRDGTVRQIASWVVAATAALGAVYQVLPGQWSSAAVRGWFHGTLSMPAPSALADPVRAVMHVALAQPVVANGLMAAVLAGVAVSWGLDRHHWVFDATTLAALFFIWWVGQDFGILGGIGTDPSTIPVLGLLMATAYVLRFPYALKAPPSWIPLLARQGVRVIDRGASPVAQELEHARR